MEEISEILDFFREKGCEVTVYDGKRTTFDIWSNISKRYLLQDANEKQVRNFYESVKPQEDERK